MKQALVKDLRGRTLCVPLEDGTCCGELMLLLEGLTGIPANQQRLLIEGKDMSDVDCITPFEQHDWISGQLLLRLRGGKGGFASNLRSMGARAALKQTTNYEACRDLNGRRLRTVHDEEKLAEWMSNEDKRREEAEEKKRRKQEQLLRGPLHKFDHHKLGVESREATRVTEDAVTAAMEKRKAGDIGRNKHQTVKKLKMWDGDLSDSELDDDDDETDDKGKGPAGLSDSDSGTSAHVETVEGLSTRALASSSDEEQQTSPVSSAPASDSVQDAPEFDTPEAPISAAAPPNESSATNTKASVGVVAQAVEYAEIRLEKYRSAHDLESLGLEHLKHALTARGLKCGGNLQQRAERLFSVKGMSPDEYPASLRVRK